MSHWIHDTDEQWEARKERFRAECSAWHARQAGRCDWGGMLQMLGWVAPVLALTVPYACIGTAHPDRVILAMAALAAAAVPLLIVGGIMSARFERRDPRPEL